MLKSAFPSNPAHEKVAQSLHPSPDPRLPVQIFDKNSIFNKVMRPDKKQAARMTCLVHPLYAGPTLNVRETYCIYQLDSLVAM